MIMLSGEDIPFDQKILTNQLQSIKKMFPSPSQK